MTQLLIRLFIRRPNSPQDPRVRAAYGNLASVVGMVCNILLCLGKFVVGTLFGSIAITADALNNLSDASSNIVSLVGFKLAAKAPDAEHPYGHARFEYLAGLVVSVTILGIGFSLLKESVTKVLHPTPVQFGWLTVAVLVVSILVKLWMSGFNRAIGRIISSETLIATAADSRNDVLSTAAVLVAAMQTLCGAAGFTEMYMMDFKREAILMCHQGEGNWRLCRGDRRPYLKNRVLSEGGLSNPPTPIFTPEPGRACILSLTHLTADRFRLVCAPGEILPDADLLHVDMPYLFFRPDSGVRSCVTAWLEQGGTHHEALVLGDRLDRIRLFCRLWNVEFVQL